jgi:hypothetical protein
MLLDNILILFLDIKPSFYKCLFIFIGNLFDKLFYSILRTKLYNLNYIHSNFII